MNERLSRNHIALGSALAALGVALGAFGAHGLKEVVSSQMMEIFETAVRYQMYHAFGLVVTGLICRALPSDHTRLFQLIGWLFITGIVFFSGSLYCLVLLNKSWLGAITPLGGIAFVVAWTMLAYGVLKQR
jgi:uncharacterized membrane protein YgdD (TMEM256/DUF423 family)